MPGSSCGIIEDYEGFKSAWKSSRSMFIDFGIHVMKFAQTSDLELPTMVRP